MAVRTGPDHVRWLTAAPLWTSLLGPGDPGPDELDRMQRPALLRLASDDFMEELAALLAEDPARLHELEATPKSHRAPPPGAPAGYDPPLDHLKLYQPIHGEFNLVAATLICRTTGLPDKTVDLAAEETAAFVLRRLDGDHELAWTGDGWVPVTRADALADAERLLPMFPVPYAAGTRCRRLLAGLIPTSSSESAKGGGAVSFPPPEDGTEAPPDPRLEELDTKVVEPLEAISLTTIPSDVDPADLPAFQAAEAAQRLEASRFIVLDLGDILLRHAPQLWRALQTGQRPTVSGLATAYDLLDDTIADTASSDSWRQALLAVWAERERIWGETDEGPAYQLNLAGGPMDPDELRTAISGALPVRTGDDAEPEPAFETPKLDPQPATRYVVRCVYRRPACGPLHPDVVSEPSPPFAIASFFDVDAPARTIHIALPVDTTIAGLRKAPRNVTLLISRELRQQMERVTKLKDLVDGKASSAASFDLGQICSLSIPIITICALLVLLIFVILLNIVFWWLPFFRICFPVPLKARD
jgi:hypothetical protein